MCRILGYLGPELPLEDLLIRPDNSLINQARSPRHHPLMQLAGWGFGAWSDSFANPDLPLLYRRPVPAFFDDNVGLMIPSLKAHTALAHVRAATYQSETVMADENCHPFRFYDTSWIMVHNGSLPNWRLLQRELLPHCQDRYLRQMRGTTDTEFVYALMLSLLQDNDFEHAFEKMMRLVVRAMKKHDLVKPTKLKLAFANSSHLVAANLGSGFSGETRIEGDIEEMRKAPVGSPDFLLSTILEPLYVLMGKDFHKHQDSYGVDESAPDERTTAILASEPLTAGEDDWMQLPFGTMMSLRREGGLVTSDVRVLEI